MKPVLFFFFIPFYMGTALPIFSQQQSNITNEIALKLSELPLLCIDQEYPNKPGHTYNSANEVGLSPKDLHPVFYGCFDWHSSQRTWTLDAGSALENKTRYCQQKQNRCPIEQLFQQSGN